MRIQGVSAVARLSNDLDAGCLAEQAADPASEDWVIVDQGWISP
jgi:hypothetical protein